MNRLMTKLLAAACACAVGCGTGNGSGVQAGPNSGDSTGGGGSSGTPSAATLSFMVRGVNVGDLKSARLRVKSVEVRAGGSVITSTVVKPEVDLAIDTAFALANFNAPAGVDDVEFTLAFDSGTADTAKDSFDVDVRCEVLRFAGKVSLIQQNKHAVVLVDLGRSLRKVGPAMVLVPQMQLVY